MANLKAAVELTLRYAKFFHGALTDADLHRWLISEKPVSAALLRSNFPQYTKQLSKSYESQKFALARKASRFLSHIPTITSVVLTGSLAINNSKPGDDIDLMIITKRDTLWLTRLFVIPLVSLFFKRRRPSTIYDLPSSVCDSICLNLWLDETALVVPVNKRNLYTAHEVLQALSLYDREGVYYHFVRQNAWTKKYLANAYQYALDLFPKLNFKHQTSSIFHSPFSILNYLAFKIQYLYMKKRITNETITLHAAFFHPRNISLELEKYLLGYNSDHDFGNRSTAKRNSTISPNHSLGLKTID